MYGSNVGWGVDPDDTPEERLEKRVEKLEKKLKVQEDDDNFSLTGSYYHDDD
jgi:hypothetical protein